MKLRLRSEIEIYKLTLFAVICWIIPVSAMAASAHVSFSGYVPCALQAQSCSSEVQKKYVFGQTVGVEYVVRNTASTIAFIRPVVKGSAKRAVVQPKAINLAPGEAARFLVFTSMNGSPQKRFSVCSQDSLGGTHACQSFLALVVK